jgi:general stress protein YciG
MKAARSCEIGCVKDFIDANTSRQGDLSHDEARDFSVSRRDGMSLFGFLHAGAITDQEVRSEIWRLGGRHLGAPLEGALEELNDPQLSRGRADLLRACVRKLQAS